MAILSFVRVWFIPSKFSFGRGQRPKERLDVSNHIGALFIFDQTIKKI